MNTITDPAAELALMRAHAKRHQEDLDAAISRRRHRDAQHHRDWIAFYRRCAAKIINNNPHLDN